MGGNLTPYTKSATPKMTLGGSTGTIMYCSGADSYNPNEAKNAKGNIDSIIESLKSEVDASIQSISSLAEETKNNFGTKFISINGHALDFVDTSMVTSSKSILDEQLNIVKEELNAFFETCSSGESSIKEFLSKLVENDAKHTELENEKERYETEIRYYENKNPKLPEDERSIKDLKEKLKKVETELEKYYKINDPTSCGQWQWN